MSKKKKCLPCVIHGLTKKKTYLLYEEGPGPGEQPYKLITGSSSDNALRSYLRVAWKKDCEENPGENSVTFREFVTAYKQEWGDPIALDEIRVVKNFDGTLDSF